MNLFGNAGKRRAREDFWEVLDVAAVDTSEYQALIAARSRLDEALIDLGKLDFDLRQTLDQLRCDLVTETPDHLHGEIAISVEPDIKAAVASLADAIVKARSLMDEVTAVRSSRRGSNSRLS